MNTAMSLEVAEYKQAKDHSRARAASQRSQTQAQAAYRSARGTVKCSLAKEKCDFEQGCIAGVYEYAEQDSIIERGRKRRREAMTTTTGKPPFPAGRLGP